MPEIWTILTLQVGLPLMFLLFLWRGGLWQQGPPSRVHWLLEATAFGSVIGFQLTVGNWGWTSVYLWVSFLLLLPIALVRSFQSAPSTWWSFDIGKNWHEKLNLGVELLILVAFLPMLAYALSGYTVDANRDPISLRFPLQDGVYYVGQGGANNFLNYHNANRRQRYAIDISKLNAFGVRAEGFYPETLEKYAIYGDTLHSPCTGTISKVGTGRPDLQPPRKDTTYPRGNHLVIECQDVRVVLAHMKEGSVAVNDEDTVRTGRPIGRVGNSGRTTEPHLHIHAEQEGEGVPIRFDGRFLVRNSLVWK